ncbi:hypothetical protein KL921_005109 [Ogataea angusta]|nr:hypothetical protein KL921_005109 [Ogataea angusta]
MRSVVLSLPRNCGKHSTGSISKINRHPTVPENRHRERHERAGRAEREHRVDRLALEHQTQQTLAHKPVEPHSVDGRPGVRVNAAPHARQRDAPVSGVRVQHARRGQHAGEVHDVRENDSQGGHRDGSVSGEDLAQERHKRLPQLSFHGGSYVDDRVRHAELEREAEHGAQRRGQHDRVRRHDLGVFRLLCEVERGVEARHDPDRSHEAHQDGHAVGPVGHVGDGPRVGVRVELWQPLLGPRVAAQEHHPADEEKRDIQQRREPCDVRDPPDGHRGDAGAADGDGRGEQERVPLVVLVAGVCHLLESQDHGCRGGPHGRTPCDLGEVVGPAHKPGQERLVPGRREHCGGVVQPARRRERRGDLCHRQRNTHDARHRHKVHPRNARRPRVGHRVPQRARHGGQQPQRGERHGKRRQHRQASLELLFVPKRKNNRLVVVHSMVQTDSRVRNHRLDPHVVNR